MSLINSYWSQTLSLFLSLPPVFPPPLTHLSLDQPLPVSAAGVGEGEGESGGADGALLQGAPGTSRLWKHQERRHARANVSLSALVPASDISPTLFFFSFWLFTETEGGNAVSVPYCSICSDSDRLCFFLVNLLTGGLDRQLRPPQATWASFPLATGNLMNKKYHTYPASNWNKVNKAMPVSEAKHLCSIFWI